MDSPCINICVIDEASGLCRGCARSISEITDWATMTAKHRAGVMADLANRREGAGFTDMSAYASTGSGAGTPNIRPSTRRRMLLKDAPGMSGTSGANDANGTNIKESES